MLTLANKEVRHVAMRGLFSQPSLSHEFRRYLAIVPDTRLCSPGDSSLVGSSIWGPDRICNRRRGRPPRCSLPTLVPSGTSSSLLGDPIKGGVPGFDDL